MLSEDSASNVRWLRLDASLLKQQLVSLCDNWVNAFQALLTSQASRQLAGLTEELTGHIAQLTGRAPLPKPGQAIPGGPGDDLQDGAEAAAGSGSSEAEPDSVVEDEAGAPVLAVKPGTRQQAQAEELEALHGQLQAQAEELEERIGACRDKYEALVQLQVRALGTAVGGETSLGAAGEQA